MLQVFDIREDSLVTKAITSSEVETVRISSDKKIEVSVVVKNTGSQNLYGHFYLDIFYADALSDPYDEPADTYVTWLHESEAHDSRYIYYSTLEAGASKTWDGESPVDASTWSEGTKIDAGIVLRWSDPSGRKLYYLDVLKIADAIEIVAPAQRFAVEISDVEFSEA